MKIITQLVILTLSLLLVDAGEHCNYLLMKHYQLKRECNPGRITINNCCDLTVFPYNKAPNDVYQMKKCIPGCDKITPFTTVNTDVYCKMDDTLGGWTVIQRHNVRDTGSENFNKIWKEYVEGFGNLERNFWYGLKAINCLTQTYQSWEMKMNYKLKSGEWHHPFYDQFSVGSAKEGYPLTVGGFHERSWHNYIDWFADHPLNGMKFSTPDNDNDQSSGNCAAQWKNGWWYNNCTSININAHKPYVGSKELVYAEMMIRPKHCLIN